MKQFGRIQTGRRAMPFPFGVWKIDANGSVGQLAIDGIDSAGNIVGVLTVDGDHKDKLEGFWNEASQSIIFQRLLNNAQPTSLQVYTGYLFQDPLNTAASPFSLAGHFETFSPDAGGTAQRSTYGWYALWTAPPPPSPEPGPVGEGGGGGGGGGPIGRPGPHPIETRE